MTLGNLACGVCALLWLFEAMQNNDRQLVQYAGWLMVLATVFDALDGKLARLTRTASDFGAQLDSLADVVTFGVVPAVLVRTLLQIEGPTFEVLPHPRLMVAGPILFACCAALRLARFTASQHASDQTQTHEAFEGLPTPGAACVLVALVLTYFGISDPDTLIPISEAGILTVKHGILLCLPFLMIPLAVLMVTRVPFPHFVAWMNRTRHPFQRTAEMTILLVLLFVEPEFALLLLSLTFVILPALRAGFRAIPARSRFGVDQGRPS